MHDSLAFFDAIAPRYDRDFAWPSAELKRRMAVILAALGPAPRRVLDLGIGTGRELAALLDAGHQVVGLDLSPKMVAECHKRARSVPITIGDLYAPLPWPSASFEVVLALHGTLAHPPSEQHTRRMFVEVARVLEPGGVFCFEVPQPSVLSQFEEVDLDQQRFVARDPRSGQRLAGVAWPLSRWQALAPKELALRALAEPNPFELTVEARRA